MGILRNDIFEYIKDKTISLHFCTIQHVQRLEAIVYYVKYDS